jgi:hypothetical protein
MAADALWHQGRLLCFHTKLKDQQWLKATASEISRVCEEAAPPLEEGNFRYVACHHWQPRKVYKNQLNHNVIDFCFGIAIINFKVEICEMFQPSFTAL